MSDKSTCIQTGTGTDCQHCNELLSKFEKDTIEAFVEWLREADIGADLVYKFQNDRGESVSDEDLAAYIVLFSRDRQEFTQKEHGNEA